MISQEKDARLRLAASQLVLVALAEKSIASDTLPSLVAGT
jgi:hypothetical protein